MIEKSEEMMMFVLLLLWLSSTVLATPSAMACPFTLMVPRLPLDPTIGEMCPSRSFLYYYACCEDNLFQCCFYFERWAIIFVAIVFTLALIGLILWFVRIIGKANAEQINN